MENLELNKNEVLYKIIEEDIINSVKNNSSESIEKIIEKIKELLFYYKNLNRISHFEITTQDSDGLNAVIIRVKDTFDNRWQYVFKSKY